MRAYRIISSYRRKVALWSLEQVASFYSSCSSTHWWHDKPYYRYTNLINMCVYNLSFRFLAVFVSIVRISTRRVIFFSVWVSLSVFNWSSKNFQSQLAWFFLLSFILRDKYFNWKWADIISWSDWKYSSLSLHGNLCMFFCSFLFVLFKSLYFKLLVSYYTRVSCFVWFFSSSNVFNRDGP